MNERDDFALTPLHHAAMRGHVSATKQLLRCPNIDIEVIFFLIHSSCVFRMWGGGRRWGLKLILPHLKIFVNF